MHLHVSVDACLLYEAVFGADNWICSCRVDEVSCFEKKKVVCVVGRYRPGRPLLIGTVPLTVGGSFRMVAFIFACRFLSFPEPDFLILK